MPIGPTRCRGRTTTERLTRLAEAIAASERLAVLTGAGVSAPSGLATFRGAGGIWNDPERLRLATPEGYLNDPLAVWRWYAQRLDAALAAEPNPIHTGIVDLERHAHLTLVTQNVDGLHRRAGSRRLLELHGDLTRSRCEACGHLDPLTPPLTLPPRCTACGARARPNVVWFGEALPETVLAEAIDAFARCDVALVIGTSGVVHPAASLIGLAADMGALTAEINPEETELSGVVEVAVRVGGVEGMRGILGGVGGG
jgi:NAD-dependent deacetylase